MNNNWFTWFTTLSGAIAGGVLGLLSPLIHEFITKGKRKKEIKHQLVELLHSFYEYNKHLLNTFNWNELYVCKYNLNKKQLNIILEKPPNQRIEQYKKDVEILLELQVQNSKVLKEYGKALLTNEAKIHSIVYEIQDVYNNEHHKSVKVLIRKEFEYFNDANQATLFEYKKMTVEQLNDVDLNPRLIQECKKLDNRKLFILDELNAILSN